MVTKLTVCFNKFYEFQDHILGLVLTFVWQYVASQHSTHLLGRLHSLGEGGSHFYTGSESLAHSLNPHHQQGRIDFDTVNPFLSTGKDFLIHSLQKN